MNLAIRPGAVVLLGALLAGAPTAAPAGAQLEPASAGQLAGALAAARGKIVLLNFWATWCTPCLREIPDLLQLQREFAELRLLAVGMDDAADLPRVESFRRRHFPEFESYLRNEPDMDSLVSVVDPAWNELLPTTYLIGRDGRVVKRLQGRQSLATLRAEVAALLQ